MEASLLYKASSRTVKAVTQRNPVPKNHKTDRQPTTYLKTYLIHSLVIDIVILSEVFQKVWMCAWSVHVYV